MASSTGTSAGALSEETVQDAFHGYLKSSLTHAKIEKLLDAEALSSAESDLMITGPALCLYFAALRCTTDPPSVPLPRPARSSSSSPHPPIDLSPSNCPPTFKSFLQAWSSLVPRIQSLIPEHQHDLARIICGLPPIGTPVNRELGGIAAEMRGIALEIGQRRTFQDRYATALQAALDFDAEGGRGRGERVASFVPPPVYEPGGRPSPSPVSLSPSASGTETSSPTILVPGATLAIEFIRETLYAALADTFEAHPSLLRLMRTDPARAYFGSVSLAILCVATNSVDLRNKSVIGVLGAPLTLNECPDRLKPLMMELLRIAAEARELSEDDDLAAVEAVEAGRDVPEETRMERARGVLLEGVGREEARGGRRSTEGRAVTFANRVGRLAVKMMEVKEFRERQDGVFRVLAGIQ